MDTRQITEALHRAFHDEGHRIVFWNDAEREFEDLLPAIDLPGITVLRLDETGALTVKIRIEREDPAGRYLLYSPSEEPDYEDDWLLDIRLYSRAFRADRASLILHELGLESQHLRQHLTERRKFFDNKERLQKLKQMVAPADTAADLDRKMMAVVARADQPELFNLIRTLFHAYGDQAEEADGIELDNEPAIWEQLAKFDLSDSFWQMVRLNFGYEDEAPTLKKLLIRLFVTDFAHHLKASLPAAIQNLALPTFGRPNAVVCLAQWRDSSSRGSSYDRLSELVAALLKLEDHLHAYHANELIDVMTFEEVEKRVASGLRELLQDRADTIASDEVRTIASRRQSGHWAGHWASMAAAGAHEVKRRSYHSIYGALVAAAEFFELRNRYQNGFDFDTAEAMYRAYETELYRFDQLYRQFCENADLVEAAGWSVLKSLRDELEACYVNWYLPKLCLAWGNFIDPQGKTALLNHWRIEKIPSQQEFYHEQVKPRLEEAENRKTYVIISDAFRYEAAQELTQELNGKYRFEASLSSQLGVLPSYTALGMASLLPHETLEYKHNGDILTDGKPTRTLEERNEILQTAGGAACRFKELMAMKKEEGREFVGGNRVIYVYHDAVDEMGDKAATEDRTFFAVRMAIGEIADLVAYIINNLNGNHVIITADHGFLFAESAPGEPEKSKLTEKPVQTVQAKKRYLIGHELPDHESVWHGATANTAGAKGGMEFWIPRGANRFHFAGGAKFIHGGAMLQEVVVPVITVRHVKGRSARLTRIKAATVQVLGASHRITTHQHRFELLQTEPVSDRVKPVTLKIAVYEGSEPVTNIETVTFDSTSDKWDDRRRWVSLVLRNRAYNKATAYKLVLQDIETGMEQSVPIIIDRAFSDDF